MISLGLLNLNTVYSIGLQSIFHEHQDIQIKYSLTLIPEIVLHLKNQEPVNVLLLHPSNNQIAEAFQLCFDIKQHLPETSILIFFEEFDLSYVQEAFACGASGYLSTHDSPAIVIDAIRCISQGKHYLSPTMSPNLVGLLKKSPVTEILPDQVLSPTELDIFIKLGKGQSAKEVASDANRSLNTINTHINRMKQKLSMPTTADMYYLAYQWVSKHYTPDRPTTGVFSKGSIKNTSNAQADPDDDLVKA